MAGKPRVLVIGSAALGSAVSGVLPGCESVATEALLSGLWTSGHQDYDGVVVSLSSGRGVMRAIRSLRAVSPQARIIVTCAASEEPRAREALAAGADGYVLEPVSADELAPALGFVRPRRPVLDHSPLPSMHEIGRLGDVLRHLDEGLQATLDRLAELLRAGFNATGAALDVDELAGLAGDMETPVIQEPLRDEDAVIGGIALAARRDGSYSTDDAARLADYARLIETIVAQVREQAHWQDLAWRDDLSGLRNRRYFDGMLAKLIKRATAERLRLTVLMFDIDNFKTYNDEHGHDTGDALIREVALLLTRCSREHDVVARYGGDEFVVLLWDAELPRVPGSQHPTEPLALADRFRSTIADHNFSCLGTNAPGPVTISGGLACFPWDGRTPAEIMLAADTALLAAKREGKNRIVLAEQSAAERNLEATDEPADGDFGARGTPAPEPEADAS